MFFLIVAIGIFLVLDILKTKKIYSPGVIFNGIFFVTLWLYELKLSYIQHDLLPRTVFCLWVAVICFNVAYFFCGLINTKRTVFVRLGISESFNAELPSGNGLTGNNLIVLYRKRRSIEEPFSTVKLNVINSIVVLLFGIQVVYSGGVPLIWKLIGSSKIYFDFGIPSLTGAFNGLVICMGAFTLFKRGYSKFIYIAIPLLVISRQVLVSIVVEGIIYKLLTLKKKPKHLFLYLIIGAIVGVVIFSAIGNFRTGEDNFLYVVQFKEQYSWMPTGFKWIYSYMTFSVSNFNNLVSMTAGFENYGASMANALIPTVLTNLFSINKNVTYYFLVSPNFTVSTYLVELYLDFGLVGIGLFSVLLAIISSFIYSRTRMKNSNTYKLIYAVVLHNILTLFFQNMFLYLPIVCQFVYIPLLFGFKKNELIKVTAIKSRGSCLCGMRK